MINSKEQLNKMGSRKILNKVFYELISLVVMYKDYEYSDFAAFYAKKTISSSNFNIFKMSNTDLYNLFFYLENINDFKLDKSDLILFKRTYFDINLYVRFLRKMATGSLTITECNSFIRKIMKSLYIEDNVLIAISKLIINWDKLLIKQKKLALVKLERYGMIHYRRSQVYQRIKEFEQEINVNIEKPIHPEIEDLYNMTDKESSSTNSIVPIALGVIGGLALKKFLNNKKSQ